MRNNRGFTIVELLVAMAISLLVMGSIYSVYQSQQKSYIVQEQVAVMQQNLRAGMTMLTRDIRMAGYDPSRTLGSGIEEANSNDLTFTRYYDDDAVEKTIKYSLSGSDLVRSIDSGSDQLIAENIDALDFIYLDSNGNETATLANIRSIQVTIVARAGRLDQGYVDEDIYYNQQGDQIYPETEGDSPNDSYRRRVLTREIKCRNLGLS